MKFDLEWRESPSHGRGPIRFLDYLVDGRSVLNDLNEDRITPLGWGFDDDASAERLLGVGEPDLDGRVAIFVCPACGDIDCGATTAVIASEGEEIIWREFADSWRDYGPPRRRPWWRRPRRAVIWRHNPVKLLGESEFRFVASDYQATITGRPAAS